MEIIYGDLKLPINDKKDRSEKNQIVLTRKDNKLVFKIFLSNEVCRGSTKPLVSITNQIVSKYDAKGYYQAKDFMMKKLNMIRILTINT